MEEYSPEAYRLEEFKIVEDFLNGVVEKDCKNFNYEAGTIRPGAREDNGYHGNINGQYVLVRQLKGEKPEDDEYLIKLDKISISSEQNNKLGLLIKSFFEKVKSSR